MKVLDLFSGAGGLSLGFREAGFEVTGVDISPDAVKTYRYNKIGKAIRLDLSRRAVNGDYDVIMGGPPCRPWSSINVRKRGERHPDHMLLSRFFLHVKRNKPHVFLLENVIPLKRDELFTKEINSVREMGYSVQFSTVTYSDFGAATRRKRLITFGIRDGDAGVFFAELEHRVTKPSTVRDALNLLYGSSLLDDPDHVWPKLRTIERYREYYRTGKFGWYVLKWDEPAPSFGNIMKTYILHPDSFDGGETRVISIKEALLIMGFDMTFSFPKGLAMGKRYQMVADAVSPRFSRVAAEIIRSLLG